jgi:hypothetical protein
MESGSGFPVQRFKVFWNPTTEEDGFLAAYLDLFLDKKKRYRQVFLMILFLFVLPQCAPGTRLNIPRTPVAGTTTPYPTRLPPAQQYAGEVLSYMIQVVTGTAGKPAMQHPWRERGVNSGLGLMEISEILSDPAKDNGKLMVYDMNVRGLSKVLYHYDPRLNQFKGAYAVDGIYPSAELIALRLLLLDLIHDGHKVDLVELYRLIPALMDQNVGMSALRRNATGLSAGQLELMRSALLSEPDLAKYLHHPFMVAALDQVGVLENNAAARRMVRRANYRRLRTDRRGGRSSSGATIAILPSMVKAFRFGPENADLNAYGFQPNAEYLKVVGTLMQDIVLAAASQLSGHTGMPKSAAKTRVERENESELHFVQDRITFLNYDQRPLVVHPGNADKVIADLCPDADIVIIILGKNVDRSIHFDSKNSEDPNRFYFDIMDITWRQVDEEMAQIGEIVSTRMPQKR